MDREDAAAGAAMTFIFGGNVLLFLQIMNWVTAGLLFAVMLYFIWQAIIAKS